MRITYRQYNKTLYCVYDHGDNIEMLCLRNMDKYYYYHYCDGYLILAAVCYSNACVYRCSVSKTTAAEIAYYTTAVGEKKSFQGNRFQT